MTETQQGAADVAPFSPNGTALYNPDDDTLRWSNADRLSPSEYAEAKALGFKLWRGSSAWVATWTPEREDFLLQHVEQIDFEPLTDDVESRKTRFASRARAAQERGAERAEAASQGLPPMGEPLKVDHPSARRHRRALERSEFNMGKAVEEFDKADYWRSRAAGVERRARQKSDPDVVRRRIERLEADRRRHQQGQSARWVEHLDLRLAFERARLDSLNPAPFATAKAYKKGDIVKSKKWGKCEVVGVGPKNLKLKILEGGARGMVMTGPAYEAQPWEE